ncbi:uncharacterized protein LOC119436617 isoform X3 [Dermacentor silvarum]|uniref:uncharacterized protein LOC119436617 isoform X3 n=1 Tax=Dermacentor silvarum TaxID=543639 RepID=UPI0018993CB2|nr:uncharacterized protein LOC119436617 isoform X3 [Dermacentor silvarum]XP_037559465.1 uncharacterized protein LOC119436617 isoform X3 [Dermacentor silvarum]XP_037559466.1 uncharacterized protein LOC119436617 isoform X3 [Dermacentor silvarum]XP_049515178.1 uncharacterized protein LOC119436617 isoform X3 [Dermacentor silvarum]
MGDAPEMAPQTTSNAGGGSNDFQDFDETPETHRLLQPPSYSTQVTNSPSVSPNPNHSSSRKSSKKKAHRKRRQGSVSQSVADSKYSTNSPSSSTVNDEIFVPLTDSKSSAAMELTILEASPIDSADIPTVLVQPPSSTPSITASKDEQILEALREIVRNCTVQDPEKRPSATQVHTMLSKLL